LDWQIIYKTKLEGCENSTKAIPTLKTCQNLRIRICNMQSDIISQRQQNLKWHIINGNSSG